MRAGTLPPPLDLPLVLAFGPETGLPLGPSAADWLRLSLAQRQDLELWLMGAYAAWEAANLAPEGTDHADAQRDLYDRLRGHFDRRRRGVFLATNLLVQYPDAVSFVPDLMAVLDAPLHARNSWVVAVEGKGPDFVLEFLHNGDRRKDLVRNVALLARLGVPEYFVFDARRNTLHGWRLPQPDAALYQPVVPQLGFWASEVLGLELTVLDGEVRAYRDGSPVLGSGERIELLGKLVADAQAASKAAAEHAAEEARRAEEETRRAEEETRRAEEETRRAEEAARRADEEARRAEAEARRADAAGEQARLALDALRDLVRSACVARGWTLNATQRARLDSCAQPAELLAWITGAAGAADAESLFGAG